MICHRGVDRNTNICPRGGKKL